LHGATIKIFLACKHLQRQGFFRGNNKIILGPLSWKKVWETLGHKPSAWFPLGPILASPAEVSAAAKKNRTFPQGFELD